MDGRKLVKLYVYEDRGEETLVDSYEAKSFDDFVLITIGSTVTVDEVDDIHKVLSPIFDNTDKRVLLVPEHLDLKIYGVKETE